MIASVGLEAKRRTRGRALSGGQRRRLDVALGVVGDPDLLLFLEPTTGFDPQARRQFWELITDLRAAGTSRGVHVAAAVYAKRAGSPAPTRTTCG